MGSGGRARGQELGEIEIFFSTSHNILHKNRKSGGDHLEKGGEPRVKGVGSGRFRAPMFHPHFIPSFSLSIWHHTVCY